MDFNKFAAWTLTPEQGIAIVEFVDKYTAKEEVNLVNDIIEDSDCGVWVKKPEKKPQNIQALAVAATVYNEWYVLTKDLKVRFYKAEEIL